MQKTALGGWPLPIRNRFRLSAQTLRVMRMLTLFLFVGALAVSAKPAAQTITFSGNEARLKDVFKAVEKQTGYVVFAKQDLLTGSKRVSVSVENMPLHDFLSLLLNKQGLDFRLDNQTIFLSRKSLPPLGSAGAMLFEAAIPSPPLVLHITDSTGAPLEGAAVFLLNNKQLGTTDARGNVQVNVAAGEMLRISFVGYETISITVNAAALNNAGLAVVLKPAVGKLDEVLLNANTGYQSISKERATGSYSVVTAAALKNRLEVNVLDRLEGVVAGLYMSNGNVNIRGLSTIYGLQIPLYVVDGFPYEGDLGYINPADVVNVTVLKDAAAASIYGARAANGVISITTRLGNAKKLTVNVSSTTSITPVPNVGKMNLLNAAQMVDLQQELFNTWHPSYSDAIRREGQPKAMEALYNYEQGIIDKTTLDATLNRLRQQDMQSDVNDQLLQSAIVNRESFSLNGGNDIHQYSLTANYNFSRDYNLLSSYKQTNIGLRDKVKVSKWLDAEIGIITNITDDRYAPVAATGFYRNMPYEALKNADGSNASWNYLKSQYEIDRLKSLGLLDETYSPLDELQATTSKGQSNYFRLQGGFTAKIIDGLSLDLKYQTERGSSYSSTFSSANAYDVRTMINDATQIIGGEIVKNVPDGGQLHEVRGNTKSYTARAQLNFDKKIGSRHQVTALAGGERRAVVSTGTATFKMGYNDNNLLFMPVDELALGNLLGTQSLTNQFSYNYSQNNNFSYIEDRYISGYGNIGYTYNRRYNLSGSVRIDDSNLFGADPKYRYVPLWSFGAGWRMGEEEFIKKISWINNLGLRATYGIGGNVVKRASPFLQAKSGFFSETNAVYTDIISPPNKELRWEKTATTNIGIDFGVLNNRISGTIDYYYRKSTDLLGERATDPTNAFRTALINYGSLYNRGIEISLNTVNLKSRNFSWNTNLVFSYNKNRMTKISPSNESVPVFTEGFGISRNDYPMRSVFNFRSAGLDPQTGVPMVYDAQGKIVKNTDASGNLTSGMMDINGLVYGGTLQPVYTAGLTQTFTYKQFALSVFIIANGGHVMRDVTQVLQYRMPRSNVDARMLNFWRKPGDETKEGIMPRPDLQNNGGSYYPMLWFASDKNTLKADYIKIRDISLAYSFQHALLQKAKISSARLILQVKNPVSWFRNAYDIDPESYFAESSIANRTLPVMPSYFAGIEINF